jgi:hypothetical protein
MTDAKFCIHLRCLKVRNFVMVDVTGLKLWHRGHLKWTDIPIQFLKSLSAKVNSVKTQKVWQTDWYSHKLHFNFWRKLANKFSLYNVRVEANPVLLPQSWNLIHMETTKNIDYLYNTDTHSLTSAWSCSYGASIFKTRSYELWGSHGGEGARVAQSV